MSTRLTVAIGLTSLASLPTSAFAQGIAIDHKPVACLVAGKYPRLDACLSPASQVARARVYFKPEDAVGWYYVVMKPEAPCFAGVLPKPTKKLVGKRFLYYLDAADRQFNENRTPDMAVEIVKDPTGCQKGMPVAPTVANASVTVFPGMPAGMVAGGLSTGAVVAVGAGTVAAVGGGIAVANAGGSDPEPTPPTPTPPSTPTTPIVPTNPPEIPPVDPTPIENRPPDADFRVSPDPPEGGSPLTVTFNMCRSTDPDGDELKFTFDYGDGATFRGNCRGTHTYVTPPGPPSAPATICVTDGMRGHERCQGYTVKARSSDPCAGDRKAPNVSLDPIDDEEPLPIPVSATVSDNVGVARVEFFAKESFGSDPEEKIGTATTAPYVVPWNPEEDCEGSYIVRAVAYDVCGNTAEDKADVDVFGGCGVGVVDASRTLGLTSDLRLPGGRGRVVIGGRDTMPAGGGPVRTSAAVEAGDNLVEGFVLEGQGQAGTWHFDLAGAVEPGSLRVEAGEVALVTQSTVVFRVSGRAGERVALRFRARSGEDPPTPRAAPRP